VYERGIKWLADNGSIIFEETAEICDKPREKAENSPPLPTATLVVVILTWPYYNTERQLGSQTLCSASSETAA
jgi:hypothetical protein